MFLTKWNYAEIQLLLKKDDSNIANYRPISLLNSFSEIFEKAIYVRMYQHLSTNIILLSKQFCFRAKSSTAKATFNLISEILDAVNNI